MCGYGDGEGFLKYIKDNKNLLPWRRKENWDNDTHHNAAIAPSWQTGTNQTSDKVCRGRAVVPADPGGKRSHGGMVEVQGAAVCGVRIQSSESCLPSLRKSDKHTTRNSFWAHIWPFQSEAFVQSSPLHLPNVRMRKLITGKMQDWAATRRLVFNQFGLWTRVSRTLYFFSRVAKYKPCKAKFRLNFRWLLLMILNATVTY